MRNFSALWLVLATLFGVPSRGEEQNASTSPSSGEVKAIEHIASALSNKVAEVILDNLSLTSAKPDTNVTETIRYINDLGQKLLEVDGESETILVLNESIVAVIDTLKARRIYKYQLWAEGRLEQVSSKLEKEKRSLSTSDLINLYLLLGEINVAYITENMLNREIMATMATIYDRLDFESKKLVRQKAIQQQADLLSPVQNLQRRRTPDEF